MQVVVWHGTQSESYELLDAIKHNCGCIIGLDGVQTQCSAHSMLLHDQRALNGLLFDRRIVARLLEEEFRN